MPGTWLTVIFNIRFFGSSLAAVALACASPAQEKTNQSLIDARSAIRQISANDPESKIELAEKALGDHLRDFCERSASKPPEKAAAEWLGLVDEAIALPHRSFSGSMGGAMGGPVGSLYNVLITLPGPDAWPAIRSLAEKRRPSLDRTALLMLCARLTGDDEGLLRLCDEYDRQVPPEKGSDKTPSRTMAVRIAVWRRLGRLNDPKVLEQALDQIDPNDGLPSLTEVLPAAQAKEVILHVIRNTKNWLPFRTPEDRKLAQEVVLDHLKELPTAPWSLAEDSSDLPYVQSLIKQCGYASLIDPNSQAGTAQEIYFRDLALHGNLNEAAKLINDLQYLPQISAHEWGTAKNLDQFIAKLQTRTPHKDLWDLYVNAAIASGHVPAAIKRLQTEVSKPSTPHELKLSLLGQVFDLHVRLGDLNALGLDCDEADRLRRPGNESDPVYEFLDIALASGDEKLIEKGIAHELKVRDGGTSRGLFEALVKRGRFGQLEQLELQRLKDGHDDHRTSAQVVDSLCTLYYRANRPLDILALLSKFPYWPAKDVAQLYVESGYGFSTDEISPEDSQPTGFYAAWALNKTGQSERATRILRGILLRNGALSPCYALLNEIGGTSALHVYDDLIAAHSFTADPLLWKGDLLFRLGKIDEAADCVRQAETIDPVGSYTYREKLNGLLGQILKKKGDTQGARRCADHVSAIQLARRGSEFERLKLLPQARETFERAVEKWPDDAALRTDLARCLALQDHPDLASEQFRKALKFLPASLGERSDELTTFGSDLEPVAKEVLNRIIGERPNDAEAFYARGKLNLESRHYEEAASDFRKAVSLDPRHVGAWQSLAALGWSGQVSRYDVQDIELRLISLTADPEFGWMQGFDLGDMSDLAPAYLALKSRLNVLPTQEVGPLFPLHGQSEARAQGIVPEFDWFTAQGRLIGRYFQMSRDIQEIAGLYHRTNYPFD